jgi:NAD(P)-dependent dehydrogenase (short-subunit alcohol dehydrogenase family)
VPFTYGIIGELAAAMRQQGTKPELETYHSGQFWVSRVEWVARHPAKRAVRVEEVAAVVCFLVSEAASAVTGACLPVDLGLLIAV